MSFKPRIDDAHDPTTRMDALCELIEYWIGPRHEDYGESQATLMCRSLPEPLRKLYEFAGRWPGFHCQFDSPFTVGAFNTQDGLFSLSQLKTSDSGKVEFLTENQGCWVCRTLSEGNDPPVWCEGDWFDENGNCPDGENQICESLSRFLVTFVLQEMTLGSQFSLFDKGLEEQFQRTRNEATPVWLNGPYVYGTNPDFYLWNDVLVGRLWGSYRFGANSPAGIDFLMTHQGKVIEIQLTVGSNWLLEIQQNGAATVEYRQSPVHEKAPVPTGTFNFLDLIKKFEQNIAKEGSFKTHPILSLHRAGQSSTIGRPLEDSDLVNRLFDTAIEFASPQNPKFAELMKEVWPFQT